MRDSSGNTSRQNSSEQRSRKRPMRVDSGGGSGRTISQPPSDVGWKYSDLVVSLVS